MKWHERIDYIFNELFNLAAQLREPQHEKEIQKARKALLRIVERREGSAL